MSLVPGGFGFGRRSRVFDPFSLDGWDPFEDFIMASTPFFSSDLSVPRSSGVREAAAMANARFDWKETSDSHIFKADLPGMKKEEVKVELQDGRVLEISGERKREAEEGTDQWHRVERSHGKFARRFQLPENVKVDEIKAAMDNGVLTITVPKEAQPKSEVRRSIQISG